MAGKPTGQRMRLALALALWPLILPAQDMTPAEEAAYDRLFQMTMAGQQQFAEGDARGARETFAATLDLIDSALPERWLTRAAALHDLAAAEAEAGDLPRAEATAREALALREGQGGVPRAISSTQWLLATILADLDRKSEARGYLEAALNGIMGDPNGDSPRLPDGFAQLAVLAAELGDHGGAEDLLAQLEPHMAGFAPEDQARVFTALGRVKSLAGQPVLAEAAYRRALLLAQGGEREAAVLTGNLATMLLQQGRGEEATALFEQALAQVPEGAPLVRANLLDGLGQARLQTGTAQTAWEAQRAALDLRLQTLPAGHPQLAASFLLTGTTLLAAGEAAVAEQALAKAEEIARANGDILRAARAGVARAAAEATLGRPAFGRAAAAAADLVAALPPGHPEATRARFNAAWIGLSQGEATAALPLAQVALSHYAASAARIGADATVAAAGAPDMRRQVLAVAAARWAADPKAGLPDAFVAAQWAYATRAARATQRMAARSAEGDGDLSALIRARQDLVDRWAALDRDFVAALAEGRADPLRAELVRLEAELDTTGQQIAALAPDYAWLTAPQPLSVAAVQAQLGPDEALLMLSTTPDATYVFAVSATAADWIEAPFPEHSLAAQVMELRAWLDPNAPARGVEALEDEDEAAARPLFQRDLAHALFAGLIRPVGAVLDGKARLLVVADGPLSSLPLSVLLASPPQGDGADPAALAADDWLAGHHAFVTLPSVAALAQLRNRPERARADGFTGFGAPDFGGTAPTLSLSEAFQGDRGRAEALRRLMPLPGTEAELNGLAKGFAAPQLFLKAQATEAAVKAADLSQTGILAFATHGLIAGEIRGLAEPSLAFTPPAAPSEADDGLLTASEAALLRLNAEWVILSACNTAAADGTPGAEALSGLAASFLYAGARGLLVSHWPVRDDAAMLLTQLAVRHLQENPQSGQAGALKAAMDDLRRRPGFEHPSAWAPFVVVGDGS